MFRPVFLCYNVDIFIVFLAFYWSNKLASVIQLLRDYHGTDTWPIIGAIMTQL